ncbi:peptidase [Polaribacter reichenbachii]|uniref:Peptidase n=1 Tax=Polaribacter reichenbachii TaxID=996801 RepID=A0A1B8TUH7_9FLAO|nr:slipin family protein [Polaribacter reichenbachii]APZ45653.1 peptidase [Polaribacter reichenbachii]AUC19515.1 peptidase [Polaribacter reichenbachii]OBY63331.1 peptidase [Polaribacter reichenbachii]
MKRVRINVGKVGLVFKNGDYQKVITQGNHWLFLNQNVIVYDLTQEFYASVAIEVLLKDIVLADMLEIVEVKDDEIVFVYENNNFKRVLESGRYFFWKGFVDRNFEVIDKSKIYITENIDKALFANFEVNKYIRLFEVAAYEKAVLLVDDVYTKTLTGGTYRFWRNDTSIKIAKLDMRQLQLEIAGQELLTKDKATIRINFYTQYRVMDVEKALLENKDYEKQLYILMQLALRAYVGNYTLDELLENKENIANAVFDKVSKNTDILGVKIINCGMRDVILTGDMKEIMNQVLIAQKTAQANVITRREETASTRSLLNTAKLMEDNEMLFKLKEMEYVEKIADKIGEITVSGNGNMVKQLKEIFSVNK